MENSKIEWTDHTFNPWIGCTKVHQGYAHCYAETLMADRYGKVTWGPNGTRLMTTVKYWDQPVKWDREAREKGIRSRVFCASLADVFEDWKGEMLTSGDAQIAHRNGRPCTMQDARRELFELIDNTPNLDWMLLTKRPENILAMWPYQQEPHSSGNSVYRRENVWLGTSISDQASADKQIPELLKCGSLSPVLFLSCEPLLGRINLEAVSDGRNGWIDCLGGVWGHGFSASGEGNGEEHIPDGTTGDGIVRLVIDGGESGPKARPKHPAWSESLRDQCEAADVAYFHKQWGDWAPWTADDRHGVFGAHGTVMRIDRDGRDVSDLPGLHDESDAVMIRVGKKSAGRVLNGREWNGMPSVTA